MDLDSVLNKCASDMDEVMSSIESIKGEAFVHILAVHLNFITLVTLSRMLELNSNDAKLHKSIQKTAVVCASESLAALCTMAQLDEPNIKELLEWGERLQQMMTNNFNQARSNE